MPDAGGPTRFRDLARGVDPTAPPTPGGALALLADPGEPASLGPPPIAPSLVRRAEDSPPRARVVMALSGHAVSAPRRTRGRARFRVDWFGLDMAQAASVMGFLDRDVGVRRGAFDVEPDGEGTGVVSVRCLVEPTVTLAAAPGVYVVSVETEEVFVAPFEEEE